MTVLLGTNRFEAAHELMPACIGRGASSHASRCLSACMMAVA